jgi:hypothetical protein
MRSFLPLLAWRNQDLPVDFIIGAPALLTSLPVATDTRLTQIPGIATQSFQWHSGHRGSINTTIPVGFASLSTATPFF